MWKTKDGYLQERVTMPDTGLNRIVSVKIKGSELKAENEAAKRLTDKINSLSDKKVKLSEAIEMYIKESETSKKPSTVRCNEFQLKAFQDIVGECYLNVMTAGFVRKALIDSGKPNRTLNGYIKAFKTFWMWAYRCDLVKNHEMIEKLTRFQDSPEKERIQDKYLEPGELNRLLAGMNEKRYVLLSRFLCLSGMRVGEAIGLNRCDIWGSIIRVTKTYDPNNNIITFPKTFDSKREIFIQDELKECVAEIDAYVAEIKEQYGFTSDLFFPDYDGSYLSYAAYAKYLRTVSEKVIGRRATPHIFRHTHVSFLATAGISLDSIASRLGHADSRITKEIYLHRTAELKEKENQQLNKIHLIG